MVIFFPIPNQDPFFHENYDGTQILTLVHVITESKKEELYVEYFKKFVEITGRNIDVIHSDAETAMANAVLKVCPNCALKLCTFHFHRNFFPKIPGLTKARALSDLRLAITGFVQGP